MQSLPFASAWGSLKLSYLLDFWRFLSTLFRSQVIIQKFIRLIKGLHSFQEPKFLSLFHILANSQLSISQSSLYTGLQFSCRISKRAHKHDIFEFMHPRGKCVRLH